MGAVRGQLGWDWRLVWLVVTVAASFLGLPPAAWAQIGSDRYASIVVDVASGNVLEQASPDAPRYPASSHQADDFCI